MRVMAIDYGDARTGVALSDLTGTLAGETFVISQWDPEKLCSQLARAAQERGADTLVLGYPKNMDGTAGVRAEKCAAFGEKLRQATGLPVVLWDERRTTVDAHRILSEAGRHGKKRKETVDAVAASLILEGYLNSLHGKEDRL